jgi:hypothetical protein
LAPYFWLVNKQRFDAGHLGVRIIAKPRFQTRQFWKRELP